VFIIWAFLVVFGAYYLMSLTVATTALRYVSEKMHDLIKCPLRWLLCRYGQLAQQEMIRAEKEAEREAKEKREVRNILTCHLSVE
jgi:hypothetical protein